MRGQSSGAEAVQAQTSASSLAYTKDSWRVDVLVRNVSKLIDRNIPVATNDDFGIAYRQCADGVFVSPRDRHSHTDSAIILTIGA